MMNPRNAIRWRKIRHIFWFLICVLSLMGVIFAAQLANRTEERFYKSVVQYMQQYQCVPVTWANQQYTFRCSSGTWSEEEIRDIVRKK